MPGFYLSPAANIPGEIIIRRVCDNKKQQLRAPPEGIGTVV
jgi:hypothetical protein